MGPNKVDKTCLASNIQQELMDSKCRFLKRAKDAQGEYWEPLSKDKVRQKITHALNNDPNKERERTRTRRREQRENSNNLRFYR